MRFLFRWAFRLLILLLVVGIGLFLTKDALAKWWIVNEFREQGMDAKIGRLEIGFPLNSTVAASDVTIYNLPKYGGAPMLRIDDLFIDCDFSELMNVSRRLRPHFRQVRIRLTEFHLVETRAGDRNLISLPDAVAKSTVELALDESPLYFTIGNLNFSWERLKFTNLSDAEKFRAVSLNIEGYTVQDIEKLSHLRPLFDKVAAKVTWKVLLQKLFGRLFNG
ncbi:MAG TPA: hypothetical protein DCO70_05565 [Verrucomicrobiales bacterium]|nr:hypothetical protein [Verrucomicrobiales bacterium]MEC9080422.1 hypothetical protein [Verrucomicrobiota bacterium]HAH98783.1 hypothetical protein [Verrucomicrobiales bacterium]|tara:strand:+ start:2264 stop:2926 length:663 start_codon:yes stop_codon:yes gene_type:complete